MVNAETFSDMSRTPTIAPWNLGILGVGRPVHELEIALIFSRLVFLRI